MLRTFRVRSRSMSNPHWARCRSGNLRSARARSARHRLSPRLWSAGATERDLFRRPLSSIIRNKQAKRRTCLVGVSMLALLLPCGVQTVSARPASPPSGHDTKGRAPERRALDAKGPYYVDFRARTAASWGHAFVWYGKSSERAVEVAGLTPAGDTLAYMLGYFTFVPSDTGASYGDLDPDYLTASYRVYLNEADAKRVFAYIAKLQTSSPVWNAEATNCTGFIGDIAEFMGLKTPVRWRRPEDYVISMREMIDGRQVVRLIAEQ